MATSIRRDTSAAREDVARGQDGARLPGFSPVNETTDPVPPETLHAWAIGLQASEEACRRAARMAGTDHILLALGLGPIITLQPPVSAAVLLGALGVNTPRR